MELPEKIESNIVAYLQSLVDGGNDPLWPDYFPTSFIHTGESDADKTTQVIQVVCDNDGQEDPPYSGNFWHTVEIQLRTPPTLQTDADKASSDDSVSTGQVDKHSAVAAVLSDAICITDLPAQINAASQAQTDTDLKAFAAIGFTDRKPLREQTADYYMSGFAFRIYACSNAAAA